MKTEDDTFNRQAVGQVGSNEEKGSTIFVSMFETLWKVRNKFFVTVITVTAIFALISFILPKKYIAQSIILPDLDVLGSAQRLGGSLQDLATAAGLNLGVTSPSQLYPDVMLSETILKRVIYHQYKTQKYDTLVNLVQYWRFDDKDDNLNLEMCFDKLLKKVLSVSADKKTAIITLEVETPEPQLSADIANQITSELDYFQRNFRKTNASEQRKFLDSRLTEVKQDLANAEDNLKNFREKNRKVDQSPQLLLEQERLVREVELNTTLFIEFKKQYELVKIDEIKNIPIVQVLDPARPPAEKSSPKRAIITLLGALLSIFGASAWFITKEYLNQPGHSTDEIVRIKSLLREIKAEIFGDRSKLHDLISYLKGERKNRVP